jgi:HPt (histidine-containing phosphotransfer) domain-containing protein
VHNIKGTAGSFGYPRLTEQAAHIEQELDAKRHARAAVLCEGLLLEAANAVQGWTPA